jgi:hypothetical protein
MLSSLRRVEFRTCIDLGKLMGGMAIALVAIVGSSREASAGQATASLSWFFNDSQTVTSSGNAGTGNFTVGRDVVTIAGIGTNIQPAPPAPISFPYKANSGKGFVGFTASLAGGGSSGTATSKINVGAPTNGFYPWNMELKATVGRGFRAPGVSAVAPGSDPQYFDPSHFGSHPVFNETVMLGSGSSVVEQGPDATASARMSRVTDLLSQPIFTIGILGSRTGPDTVKVWFNPNPSLTFSTTASALISQIEAGIGSSGGLPSNLSFSYSLDLSKFHVTSSDFVGGGGVSLAKAAPEPSSVALAGTAALALIGYRWLLRKRARAGLQRPEARSIMTA